MRTPTVQVASALSMFYGGMSLSGIRRHLKQVYDSYPSDSTVYSWITRFTKEAVQARQDYRALAGDTWIADETVMRIGGSNMWFWDVIDSNSRFLLASNVSKDRTTRDAETLMSRAARHSIYAPDVIITDKLADYLDGIERIFRADTAHVYSEGVRVELDLNLIERFRATLKERTKVMERMQNRETAKLITDGWLVHYNFFRPHESLQGRTPAQVVGIAFPFRNWADVVRSGGLIWG